MGLLSDSGRAAFAAALMVSLSSRAEPSPPSPIVVVVGAQVSLRDISVADLRAIYLGELQTWPGGVPIVAFNLQAGSRTRDAFDREVLGLGAADVERLWLRRKLRGEGQPPREVGPGSAVLQLVQALPGAIGYVRATELKSGLAPLRIAGVSATEPSYPLRE
jgi:ABC-type phosphate transport system substrate-binding protein